MARIRTLDFLPEIFQTKTNSQFLGATLDQLVNPPVTKKIEGYIGSKFGYGINAKDYYVTEPTKVRTDYQLDPGVVFTKTNENAATDFVSYPGILDALKLQGGLVNNNNRLFNSQFYSWDSFTDLDKIINFNQYYWLPTGLPAVQVSAATVFTSNEFIVTDLPSAYNIRAIGSSSGSSNPTITLIRGGTYRFIVNQPTNFWIQGEPGVTGFSATQPNQSTRLGEENGVINNGATQGAVTFQVPFKNAQDDYNFPGNNLVGLVSTKPFSQVNGARLSDIKNIDGVTAIDGLTVMFYDTGILYETGYVSSFYSQTPYDVNNNDLITPATINVTATTTGTNLITCDTNTNLTVGQTITFTGIGFGGLNGYNASTIAPTTAGTFVAGQKYFINSLGTTDWISAGMTAAATVTGSITGTTLTVTSPVPNALQIGQTITGTGILPNTTITGYDLASYYATGIATYTVSVNHATPVASTTISAYNIFVGGTFTASGSGAGTGTAVANDPSLYYVTSKVGGNQFTVSTELGGSDLALSTATGSLVGNINQGLYEEGYNVSVNNFFFRIQLIGDPGEEVIRLIPDQSIPTNEKITAQYGTNFVGLKFFKNVNGIIQRIPYISAPLDTLYYQDGSSPNKVGVIRLIESNLTNTLNVEVDIIGKKNFTSTNGVVFTNGLKVEFDGDVIPKSYLQGQYYVEGVGTGIKLIPVTDLVVPEPFTYNTAIPYDIPPYDIGNYDSGLFLPVTQDYITIARDSISKNAWSRSNRWFHIDVINATAEYNNNPSITTEYAKPEAKAKRPIIEFYPNLRLYDAGTEGKQAIDFIDTHNTDAFTNVAGQQTYYPDVQVYTAYAATIEANPTIDVGSFIEEQTYKIVSLGTTTQTEWNLIADTLSTVASDIISGTTYEITSLGNTDWNDISNVATRSWGAGSPAVGGTFIATKAGAGSGIVNVVYAVGVTFVATQSGADMGDGTALALSYTTVTIDADEVTGTFAGGQYISDMIFDSQSVLPDSSRILEVTGETTYTLTVDFPSTKIFASAVTNVALVANDTINANFVLFPNARIIFAADENEVIRNKIYIVNFDTISTGGYPVITLTEAPDGLMLVDNMVSVLRGANYQGTSFYFDGIDYLQAQQKNNVNQPPLFDIFDSNGISFGNPEYYVGTSFRGSKLFSYGRGVGANDSVLGFPIRYSSINNVGDISFDVNLNSDEFTYVTGSTPVTQNINTGYVYNYENRLDYNRELGWQTAVAQSVQYQIFEFAYTANNPPLLLDQNETLEFICTCDVPVLETSDTIWPSLEVYNNNELLTINTDYTVTVTDTQTIVSIKLSVDIDTQIQIVLLSDQVSNDAYYSIPINLNNNPFNSDITIANIGDIRGQYQSIFINNPDTTGDVFGSNNYRDLGNMVPWGNKIIQNSASLVLPGAFLRKSNHNLFDALLFNSREYIKFKTLLVDTINKTSFNQNFDPAFILDDALDQISSTKSQEQPFFWSDMLPNKAPFITNTYRFQNQIDTSTFGLSRTYDFDTANYYGVLVYLTRKILGTNYTYQLTNNVDYTISATSPSLVIDTDLLEGDIITIKEYNQTYGSYVPNTPTKLGLYPARVPEVVLDSSYTSPTYFIVGHDGSYTKLYGDYDPVLNVLIDFRDQALLEFEKRVYNNLKLSETLPIQTYEITPGFFRDTGYTYDEWLLMYNTNFLDWVGQNRLDYKTQLFNIANQYTYNYTNTGNAINNKPISQGYWRGIYQYFYDTTTPNATPWEMIGYTNKPTWWENRYGPAPYTSENLILWTDMQNGQDWGTIDPITGEGVVIPRYERPGLLTILPVDDAGNLKQPLDCVVGNYQNNLFKRDWKIGDDAPVEFSYRRSSTWPFDYIRLLALMKPAMLFNLGADLDNYKYNLEFNQYLVNDRSHLVPANIEVYGEGTPKTSYINWIVDFEKQLGVNATKNIKEMLENLDVRLIYRLAGYSDKSLLKFYVEKGTPNSRNASLLIPDESYGVLLYNNVPYDKLIYSGVVIQKTRLGFKIFGNSQNYAYFKTLKPKNNGNTDSIIVQDATVKVAKDYTEEVVYVPYGIEMYSTQEVSQFLMSYGKYLESQGAKFDLIESGIEVNWQQMVAEFLYWSQVGWETGSIITVNPGASQLSINKESQIVQPLTIRQSNFVLNQNLYPIASKDLNVYRDETLFQVKPLNQGDTIAYGQFNLSNFEHGIVFDNVTLFDDVIYNLITGLRQNRIFVRGTKTAEWNGTVFASGFIYNQDNVKEWSKEVKYTKGEIVTYKNKYWTALRIVQPNQVFNERDWKETDYDEIQKGLLPNSSTRSYESALYYDVDKANLEIDADQLSFSLIGFRPRDYMALADLTDITQVNVYKNMIKEKGTRAILDAFKGAQLPQGGIDYEIYENWAIKQGEFGGVLNNNFVEFKVNENYLTGNPSVVALTNGENTEGAQQLVPIYSLYNYARPIDDPNILPVQSEYNPSKIFPDAGYVNYNDVKMSSYFYSNLPVAVDKNGITVPISDFYVRDYVWLANYLGKWQVMTPASAGQVILVRSNPNNTSTITFSDNHDLSRYQIFAIVNFDTSVDGYYFVNQVINPRQVLVTLTLANSTKEITGRGIALKFDSQRVDTPADIQNLPLINSEFVKNTVWVDENTDGSWAVYRKSLNYKYDKEFNVDGSITLGSCVAYSDKSGYLIGDDGIGSVYRYTYDALSQQYILDETIPNNPVTQVSTPAPGFGSAIAHAQNIYVISRSIGTPSVYIYRINDSQFSDNIQLYQDIISAPVGVTDWGSALALSGDTNWLFISDFENNKVNVYRKQNISRTGSFISGQTYQITSLGTTDWQDIGAVEGKLGIYFIADDGSTPAGSVITNGNGTATQCTYEEIDVIDASGFLTSGDNFGYSITTDYYGDTVVISAPQEDYNATTENWGKTYVYSRGIQNYEASQLTVDTPTIFTLAWTNDVLKIVTTNTGSNTVVCRALTSDLLKNTPILFTGSPFVGSNLTSGKIYYVYADVLTGGTSFQIKETRESTTIYPLTATSATPAVGSASLILGTTYVITVLGTTNWNTVAGTTGVTYSVGDTFVATTTAAGTGFAQQCGIGSAQLEPLYVSLNGTLVNDNNYGVVGSKFYYTTAVNPGDIINVSGNKFTLAQVLTTEETPRVGVQFGNSVTTNNYATEILVGAPFALHTNNVEGGVYRYTNGSARFGTITGTNAVNLLAPTKLLINGYLLNIPVQTAEYIAQLINDSKITNVQASASNNVLSISLIENSLAQTNQKLLITSTDDAALEQLGLQIYTQTQIIMCPHTEGPTQFGSTLKMNESNSFIASAPVGMRYSQTTFDFIDDENLDNDTIFDNNATQFIDTFANAGAAYMFDYLGVYNESLQNIGAFVYAQSVNARNIDYGSQPYYGTALEFYQNRIMVGTPNFRPEVTDGQVIVYLNPTGIQDWSIHRQSTSIVDINRIQNLQLFSAETNNTLINLDYFDPLQGKLLGAVQSNIDVISNIDPASYNNDNSTQSGFVWGSDKVGTIWFDTSNVRFVNYHQDGDVSYNARYWGTLFPGSDVAVYTWVASNVTPNLYQGAGIVKDPALYTVQSTINASNTVVPVYYFWVRDTNTIYPNKTLADSVIESYIQNPLASGIAYLSPLKPNAFGLYNSQSFINANDSVLHIGYSTGEKDDPSHSEYTLIRANFEDDFLPGVPKEGTILKPESLYDRLLDSLSGVDEEGEVVPNPYLPKAVQSGVLARPRQSFFYNRYTGLKNYLQYANTVLAQFPISEIRRSTFLYQQGTYYNTRDYWDFINWWAPGYDNNTKSVLQVPIYADLSTLNVPVNTIVSVAANSTGSQETYRYDGEGIWTRIGLQNGTIAFKLELWDYAYARTGFGDNFYDTDLYDQYPSEETRWIIRALNEQIYTNELLIFRNKSLILLFDYIQSETVENQNYLPWLNKTSLVDVSHTIRELLPLENFQSDNQDFLAGYLNEAKPYHVVIKEFLFEYTGTDIFEGNITDFDLPAQYNADLEQFVTPQLVYSNPSGNVQYLPDNAIWQEQNYNQWFNNYGVSISGQNNYFITTLASYVSLSSNFIIVDNAQGLPINGTITIGSEQIVYNTVDRALNTISGLQRGANDTTISDHIPGEKIFIDLPAVVLLNGGRDYLEPPKVTAYIDLDIYPEPREAAVLEAVMSLDSVVSINVINPGSGYAVLPEIRIDPAQKIVFSSNEIDPLLGTLQIFAPALQTGDLVKYVAAAGDVAAPNNIGMLDDNQWYYINVLETTPSSIIAFYTNYSDAINNHDRIMIYPQGPNENHSIETGAKASAVSSSYPVRENNLNIRFDRTTYDSQVTDWLAGRFYGSFFAGTYNNSQDVSSSSIGLQSTQPSIDQILASAQGFVLEIKDVENVREVEWSTFERSILSTNGTTETILLDPAATTDNASGSTIGFTTGMPVKFKGAVGTTGLVVDQTYYVAYIVDELNFRISNDSENTNAADLVIGQRYVITSVGTSNFIVSGAATNTVGTVFTATGISSGTGTAYRLVNLNTATISAAGLTMFTAKVNDTAILTVNYPGIREVTATTSTNALTIPLSEIGTGGTNGFYTNLPVFFTGDVFGGVIENQAYYITTVIDDQTFTMSESPDPLSITIFSAGSGLLILETTAGLSVNDPVIINNMYISNTVSSTFGSLVSGQTYYIRSISVPNAVELSLEINGPAFDPGTVAGDGGLATRALMTSQSDVVQLSDDTGSMNINISLPVSPGQVTGQQFTLYQTSEQYPNISNGVVGNLLNRTVAKTIDTVTLTPRYRMAITQASGGTEGMYERMPFQLDILTPTYGGLSGSTRYYVNSLGVIEIECTSTSPSVTSATFTADIAGTILTVTAVASGTILPGSVISSGAAVGTEITGQVSGTTGGIGVYTVSIIQTVASTSMTTLTSMITCDTTASLYENMPIVFRGAGIGSVVIGDQYYVRYIFDGTRFAISDTEDGSVFLLTNETGLMTGDGEPYITVSTTAGGSDFALTPSTNGVTAPFIQYPISDPVFDVSYILGGYRVVISDPGEGFTINNTITIAGDDIGGATPANNLVITVNTIDAIVPDPIYSWDVPIESNGYITSVICTGTPAGSNEKYYLKVIGQNTFEVYTNQLMTVPASGLTIPYAGFTTATVETLSASTNEIVVDDASNFEINDSVVFTGQLTTDLTSPIDLQTGETYKIVSVGTTDFTLVGAASNSPGLIFTASGAGAGSGTAILVGNLTIGETYYIRTKTTNTITLTDNPGGTELDIEATAATTGLIMAKAGSFAFLPEPFYFNQSIVKYNNRVWLCVVSNNDQEFILGKWEELQAGDRRLNAMDRVVGFYQPTVDMPGVDLTQLFDGVTYPNSTYKGNAFEPAQQYALDTVLKDIPFYPTNINIEGIVYADNRYVASVNLPTYSGLVLDDIANQWDVAKLANKPLNFTDIAYDGTRYVITSTNSATPIFTSLDGIVWSTNGFYLPSELAPYGTDPDLLVKLNQASLSFNAVINHNNKWIAVGKNIVVSDDGSIWRETFKYGSTNLVNIFYGIAYVDISVFTGYVAVGKGQRYDWATGVIVPCDIVAVSTNAQNWTPLSLGSEFGLYGVSSDSTNIIAVGENGYIAGSNNGTSWSGITQTAVINTMGSTRQSVILTNTAGYTVGDKVRFSQNLDILSVGPVTAGDFVIGLRYEIDSLGSTTNAQWNTIAGTTGVVYDVGDEFVAATVGTGTGTASPIYEITSIVSSSEITIDSTVTAGSFVVGKTYTILSIGTTDFTLVGAASNTAGIVFTATGKGSGDGTAGLWGALPPAAGTYIYLYPTTATLRDVTYANGKFVAVGDDGLIRESTDGFIWTDVASGTIEDLNSIIYNDSSTTFTAVGDNNTILISTDDAATWDNDSVFSVAPTVYNVVGDPFPAGYGPEELVPGVIKDTLAMTVTTRPGTTWTATEYGHVGYGTNSVEVVATSGTQDTFSFAGLVNTPAQIRVAIIGSNGLSVTLYDNYTVDWINQTVTLDSSFIPFTDTLRIDVYEVGNGDQLVKSSTFSDPIRTNTQTGLNEIFLNANYTGLSYEGGGVIRPGTGPVYVESTETDATYNRILVTDASKFTVNQQIEFSGDVFGGVALETPYYVKSISTVTNTITISDTLTGTGIAGPTFALSENTVTAGDFVVGTTYTIVSIGTTDFTLVGAASNTVGLSFVATGAGSGTGTADTAITTGIMTVIIQTANGSVFTDPVVYHNGNKLILGVTGAVTATKSATNTVVVLSTGGMSVDEQITFSNDIIGGISGLTPYYIKSIVDSNEITISDTLGGATLSLTDEFAPPGGILYITNDYAFGVAPNDINAKLIFAAQYDDSVDYLAYSILTETYPVQYGYSIPETQIIPGDNTDTYSLENYSAGDNEENAVVEIDGLRVLPSTYTINGTLEEIVFASPVSSGSTISVTTFNDTQRQYLNTWSESSTTATVANISTVNNAITPYLASTFTTDTNGTTITCLSTAGFVVDQTIQFQSPDGVTTVGNILVDGTVYFVKSIINATDFEVSLTLGGAAETFTIGSGGTLPTYVGGQPTTRITTGIPHNLSTNDVVRIDGVLGAVQLNNREFYVHVIDSNRIDLYEYFPDFPALDYNPINGATNYPIVDVSTYTGGGYVWLNATFLLYDAVATDVVFQTDKNVIEVADASKLIDNTPVYFMEVGIPIGTATSIPEIVAGTKYYIKNINYGLNTFSVSLTHDGDIIDLTLTSGVSIKVKQWLQTDVERLWVTINGERVPSSQLRVGEGNQISILSVIVAGDELIITSMIPTATPNEEVYLQLVSTEGEGSVYRANTSTRTWTTSDLFDLQNVVKVDDVSRVTRTLTQTSVTPVATLGYRDIGLDANKSDLVGVTVYNNNPARLGYITTNNYQIVVESLVPVLRITDGYFIDTGDILTITCVEGKYILVNGEIMHIHGIDVANNELTVHRGSEGTGISAYVPKYSEVYGLLKENRLSEVNYNSTWNPIPGIYNPVDGDPLQIADTQAANFLKSDDT